MAWWGKLLGGAFGFSMGGPLGAVLGAALGHQFDKGFARFKADYGAAGNREEIQAAFFTATFSVMGHIAKADGRVSRDEIQFAETVMRHMALDSEQRQLAIKLFNEGKADQFDLEGVLSQLRRLSLQRSTLLRMFLEIQLQAAMADGQVDGSEREVLERIASMLGFSAHELAHLEAMIRSAHHFTGNGYGDEAFSGTGRQAPPRKDLLKEAYQILDVPQSSTDAEVKKAYRRLMSQHHPDKLVSKGLPEEMIQVATEKTQEIKKAYELIKESRGMR